MGNKLLSGARYMIGEDEPAWERSMIHTLLGLWGLQIYLESLGDPRIRAAVLQRSLVKGRARYRYGRPMVQWKCCRRIRLGRD